MKKEMVNRVNSTNQTMIKFAGLNKGPIKEETVSTYGFTFES